MRCVLVLSKHKERDFISYIKWLLTKVELAVEFFAVDNVEAVVDVSGHVADLKVEPLMMVVGVDVWVQDQVVLKLSHLSHKYDKNETSML